MRHSRFPVAVPTLLLLVAACRWSGPLASLHCDSDGLCSAETASTGSTGAASGTTSKSTGEATGSGGTSTAGPTGTSASTSASSSGGGHSTTVGASSATSGGEAATTSASGTATSGTSSGIGGSRTGTSGNSSGSTSAGTTGGGSTAGCGTPTSTFYLSPSGNDQAPGTKACPWKTFKRAIPALDAGETLMLVNGTYTSANSGLLTVQCGSSASGANANNGMPEAPITVAAANERQAVIVGGAAGIPINIEDCAYWTLQGLTARSGDDAGTPPGGVLYAQSDTNFTVSRGLFYYVPPYTTEDSDAVFQLVTSSQVLIEENEIYDFSDNGLESDHSANVEMRRNYVNGHEYYTTDSASVGIEMFDTRDSLIENNALEGVNSAGIRIDAELSTSPVVDAGAASNDQFLGNMAYSISKGFWIWGYCLSVPDPNLTDCSYSGTVLRDNLALGTAYGFAFAANEGVLMENNTASGSAAIGFSIYGPFGSDGPAYQFLNNAAVNNDQGFNNGSDGGMEYCDAYGNLVDYTPTADHNITDLAQPIGPNNCVAYLPAGSALIGAGSNGGNIGANIVNEYQGGVLTQTPLWTDAGQFPCGAIVPGVNNTDAGNCSDFNQRVNVGGQCPAP